MGNMGKTGSRVFFQEAHDSSLEMTWPWGRGRAGCDVTATPRNYFGWHNLPFPSTNPAWQRRGSIRGSSRRTACPCCSFWAFCQGKTSSEDFYRHSFFLPQSCSQGVVFAGVLQGCTWFSTQASDEAVSSSGFLLTSPKRSTSTWGSLKAGQRGR